MGADLQSFGVQAFGVGSESLLVMSHSIVWLSTIARSAIAQ